MRIVVKDVDGKTPKLSFSTIKEMIGFLQKRPEHNFPWPQEKSISNFTADELGNLNAYNTHMRQTRAIEELISVIALGESVATESSSQFEASIEEETKDGE